MLIVGIDPGLEGCIAKMDLSVIDYNVTCIDFFIIPKIERDFDVSELREVFSKLRTVNHVFLEKVSAMPGQGVSSMFKFGRGVGMIEAFISTLYAPLTMVTPKRWQKELHAGLYQNSISDPKLRSIAAAKKLFPSIDFRKNNKCRIEHRGKVDSLLIAEYGRRALKQGFA